MSTQATDLTIRKSITVEAPIEQAFETFTGRIADWWPLATHSLGHERVETVVLEEREGGRLYERTNDGEADWGRVAAWEPPSRVVLEWKPNRDWTTHTEVEVRFTAQGSGTLVELEHRGFERLGEIGPKSAANYGSAGGWPAVLARYSKAADAQPS